jgi:hypothetical protein
METRVAYLCRTCFWYELGEALGGTTLYESVGDLQENCSCVKNGCGIVKVVVQLLEVIKQRSY